MTAASSLDHARAFARRGWKPIPVPYRAKGPKLEGWTGLRLTPETVARYFNGSPMNVGILLGEPSGGLVDIDLDCSEAIRLAPLFLPKTGSRFGRASKPQSHWEYIAPGAATVKYADPPHGKKAAQMLVELRSTGGQTVFPGSVHPSGELVEFATDGEPAPVTAGDLGRQVARLAVACVLVRAGWSDVDACAAADGGRELLGRAIAHDRVGHLVREWLGMRDETRKPAATSASSDLDEAVRRYNADRAREWPRSGGECPMCGHKDCFGRLPEAPERWACFSASHAGAGIQGPTCWHGDALDVDANAAGCTRIELMKRAGYLEPTTPTKTSVIAAGTPTATQSRLRALTEMQLADEWRNGRAVATIPTGVPALDSAIGGGLPAGQVTTVLGYTGVGKSEFARQLRNVAARAQHGVLHVDVELGARRVAERNISQAAAIASALLRRPGELSDGQAADVESAIAKIATLQVLTICPGGGVMLGELETAIREGLATFAPGRPALVILDSAQRLAPGAPGDTQRLQLQHFMWWAASLAQQTNAAFLLTSEQKRTGDGKQPTPEDALSSGAESRAIEFVSDVVLALVPAEKTEDAIAEDAASTFERRVSVLVCKTREGRTGYLPSELVFTGPCWGMRADVREDELTDAIMDHVADDGVHSVAAVTKALGKRKETVRARMRQLAGSGRLEWVDTGKNATSGYRAVGSQSRNRVVGSAIGNRAGFSGNDGANP